MSSISQWPVSERPREKLFRFGPHSLSEAELLAILLRVGSSHLKENVVVQAQRLLTQQGGLEGFTRLGVVELSKIPGVGPVKAASIVAALELAKRRSQIQWQPGRRVDCAKELFQWFKEQFRGETQEIFWMICLNQRQRIIHQEIVSRGILTASLIHPREAFRSAIQRAAAAVLFVHNHPSGDPRPSAEDRAVTQRLRKAGEILGIRMLDHLIVAEGGFFSFAESGWET